MHEKKHKIATMEFLHHYGYIGLFLGSFLSATVMPLSSEGIIIGLVYAGFDIVGCIAVATTGNWLGSLCNFWLGYAGRLDLIEKWLRIKEEKVKKWEPRVNKYSTAMALFAWLPFIGEIMAVALGFFRCNFWKTAFFILIGKLLRYIFWGYIIFAVMHYHK